MSERSRTLVRQYGWWLSGIVIGLGGANLVAGHMMWALTVGAAGGSIGAIAAVAEARPNRADVIRDERSNFIWTQSLSRWILVLLFVVPAVLTGVAMIAGHRQIPIGLVFLYLLVCIIVIALGFGINGRR